MNVLVLNGGSSSFKCWFAGLPDGPLPAAPPEPRWTARADWSHHTGKAEIRIARSDGATEERQIEVQSPVAVLEPVLESLWNGDAAVIKAPSEIDVVGHRIVHGGPVYRESTPLTAEVRAAIAREVEFAPAHNRFELEAVETVDRAIGTGILQIAVFDTGFHSTLQPSAYVYAGPHAWLERGIRRYGFHGISHQYAARRASELLARDPQSLRLIVCHLGNGASLAAVQNGRSVDTSMGFTPLEGLMMGTRSGSIDPGILIYLIRHRGYTAGQLDRILNQESGLLGLSGVSGDMREVLEAIQAGHQRAQLAFDVYVHRLVREIGGMLAVLGGVDALVFTGGIGENSALLRERACAPMGFLGLKIDAAKNASPAMDSDISAPDSAVRTLVIRAQEEWEIARECHQLSGSRVNRQRC
ncbi:MAG TPA: acetate kinase [Bryobacteraceae bacterium]|nr:acetate kinase [Bryobacteraceae bacterium]